MPFKEKKKKRQREKKDHLRMNCIKSQWFEEFHGERRVVVFNFIINFLYKSSMKNF